MNRFIAAGVAALGLLVAMPASAQIGAPTAVKVSVCNPVTQFRLNKGDVVYSIKSGNPVRHAGSFDCPEVTVYFEFDLTEIRPQFAAELDAAAAALEGSSATVYVTGHTDSVGSPGYNAALSDARAQAVASYLVSRGIASEQLMVAGVSETMPVGDNTTADGRALNRRAEMSTVAPGGM